MVSPSEHVFTSVLGAVKNQELLDTLVMYYECGANMERVSDRMYTHKNTVKYRLNRLQELARDLTLEIPMIISDYIWRCWRREIRF